LGVSSNLELVRSIYAGWERGDYGSADWADDSIEFVRADGPSPGSWTGRVGMVAATRDWVSTWENAKAVAEDYRELDGGRVLVLVKHSGRGKASGVEIGDLHSLGAQLFEVRGGKVVKCVHYLDADRALADLGIDPAGSTIDRS
jgi:ketosteroid isomerase-like protein